MKDRPKETDETGMELQQSTDSVDLRVGAKTGAATFCFAVGARKRRDLGIEAVLLRRAAPIRKTNVLLLMRNQSSSSSSHHTVQSTFTSQ